MELARVIGRVVATVKYETLEGIRLLVIQPQDAAGDPQGDPIVAADALQAGPGDLVSWIDRIVAGDLSPVVDALNTTLMEQLEAELQAG